MKKSKISILLLFIVMILAISAVSAADTNETSDSSLNAVDEAPVDEVASEDVGALAATDSNNALSTGGKNFTELQNYINSGTGAIELTSNYTRVDNEAPVVINKAITINGNRFTIDGNNNGGIFEIGQGGSVTLNDVILINGNAEKGGAIYNNGVITIVNSEFNNNNASLGGAIYNDGYIILTGSTFKDNNATTGLSIYNNGNLSSSRNTINGPIVNTGEGRIISEIRVTVLDNEVKTVKEQSVILNATITDSNNNVINQMGDLFKFTVDGAVVGNINFDPILNIYQCTYTLTNPGIYTVNVTYAGGNNLVISSKDKNLKNIRGTFTDLQNMIATSTGALSLSYDITYNEVVDADNFPNGVLINKAITIDGKGYTISGNNAYRIFNVTGNNVVIRNVTLTKGNATNGGAIYTTGNLTVDKSKFINNIATNGATYGDAIYVGSGNITISESKFNEDEAVYNNGNASIKNSDFTSDKLGAIYNSGTLALEGNSVKAIKNSASGKITSEINVLVLEGTTTVYVDGPNVKLYANVTDDNNNPIYQSEDVFKFIIDNKNIVAEFNESSLLYEAVYKFTSFGQYDVNMSYTGTAPNVIITNGTINYITGTFTDLKRLIDDTTNGGTLVLPYDFTYNPAFDGTKFPEGIVIDKVITINGKGHTISGNNSNRIFRISGVDTVVNLRNITFADGNATKCSGPISEPGKCGGAIYSTAKQLTVEDSIFDHNTVSGTSPGLASAGGAIMVESNETAITLTIKNVKFTNNIVENAGGAIHIDGAKQKINYYIYDSLFENNAAIDPFTGSVSTAAGGALYSAYSATGVINNTVFKGNKAESDYYPNAGAIKVEKGSTLTVANSTFEGNNGTYAGGAISIQAYEGKEVSLTVDTCKFISNVAENPIAILSNGNQVPATVIITNSNFTEDNAVYLDSETTATISNSVFTSAISTIINKGTLALAGNKVETILNYGTITSQVNATVLNNETRVTKDDKYNLTAIVTDDNGNLIKDTRLKFVVNDQTITTEPTYDSGVYKYADYSITMDKGEYIVGVNLTSATNLVVKTGTIKNLRVGTFTDLERLINNTIAGGTFVLPYDFTYNEAIDGNKFLNGIVIDKAIIIDGNGSTISGNNSAAVFIVNATVAIKDTIFADVKNYAIYNNATLTLTNNTISQTKALIINNGTIDNAVVKVLDNKTVNLKFNQKVILNATFKDDNGNWINDTRFTFTVTNVSPMLATYNDATGLYTFEYTVDKVETKIVSVKNIGAVAELATGTLNIARASVNITINANETIERKQNESIKVTLKDEFGNLLKGTEIEVSINNATGEIKKYDAITNNDGVWAVEVPGLRIGNYTITVIFSRTNDYNANTRSKDFEVVQLNITNTFTELQELIQAYEGTGNVLVLPHNFKYNDYVDEDFYANGVLISDDIVIDGNGTTIDSDNVYRIFNITDGITVTIKNVTLINGHASAADGAAIFTNASSLTIDSCNFLNGNSTDGGAIYIAGGNVTITDAKFINNTAYMGGAIFVAVGANLTVNGATFDNNTSPRSGAIRVGLGAFLTLSNSKFTNNLDDFNSTIGNLGTLALDSNDVDGTIYNGGKITTPVYSTVLGNDTYDIVPTLVLTADLRDGNGNKIYDPEFRFVVNGVPIADVTYNATSGKYNTTYNTDPAVRAYLVNVTSANEAELSVETSIFRNITGTFTDLQNLIDNTTAGNTLELPYDFAYVALIDGDKFPNGVVINKAITIDGKEHTISGSNSNRIFRITAATTLNNITLIEGNAIEFGGAIYTTANLNVYNSTFDHNVASKNYANGGAIMAEASVSDLTLNIKNVTFTNNVVDNAGGAIAAVGVGHKLTYNIYDSLFENNTAVTTGAVDAVSAGAIYSLGEYGETIGLINNTIFRENKALTGKYANGGAIKVEFGAVLTVANSTFDSNVANRTGGAISVQAHNDQTRLTVDNCTFTNNGASEGSAIESVGHYDSAYVSITRSKFNEDNAVVLDSHTTATISNSEFTSNANYAIYNLGKLELSGNTVKVIFNNGTITTQVNSTVKENKTYDITKTTTYRLNASLVDDNNNKIYDPNFRFVINGETISTVPGYDADKGEYNFTLDTTTERIYLVDVTSVNEKMLSTKTSIVREITGTFTDLQKQIDAADVGGNKLNLLYDFIYTPEIDEGKFDDGVLISTKIAIDGKGHTISGNNSKRIFNVTAKEVVLENLTIVNGSAIGGGAIYVADGGNLTVNKASFENNVADLAAIFVANGGKLTVEQSTFNEGRAICNNGNTIVKNSEFTSEVIFAIFNNGTLELSKNTVELIYNNGTITSTVYATFIGNKTIAAELGDKVTPNATLTDDNGNAIYDARFDITVRGTVLETDYNVTTKLYSANYTIADAGKNIVTANYPATLNTGIYDVPKANVTEFTIIVGDLEGRVAYGENATMVITLLGVDGVPLNETIYIIVNDTKIPNIKVINGEAIVNVSGLAPGKYAALAAFVDNDNYNDAYATDPFTVLQPTAILNVTVEDITYGDAVIVNITLTDNETGNPILYNTTVRIVIAGAETVVIIENGEASVEIPYSFAANEDGYLVNVTFVGDENYDPVTNDTKIFKVHKASIGTITISASALEVEAFDIVTFDFTIPIEGEYLIYENDKHQTVRLAAGEFRTSANFTVGNYTIKIVYPANQNYTEAVSNEINITVKPKEINPDSIYVLVEGDYDNPLNITLWAPVDGEYLIDLGTGYKYPINVTGGIGNMTIAKLDSGNYTYTIDIVDGNYSLETIEGTFKYKAYPSFTVNITGTYPTATITISGNSGNYTVYIDDEEYVVEVKGTEASAPIQFITAGNHVATVVLNESKQYYSGVIPYYEFTIAQADLTVVPEIVGDLIVDGPINITFTLPTDINASNVVALSDGVLIKDKLVNETTGAYTFVFDGFAAGDHAFTVNVNDPNYVFTFAVKEFFIQKHNSTMETTVTPGDITYGDNVTVTVNVGVNATGFVVIDVNGTECKVYLVNGVATKEIAGLNAGNYDVTVTYGGDDKYNNVTGSAKFTINKAESKVSIEPIADVTYNEQVEIVYNIINETSFVTISITDLNDPEKQITFVDNGTVIIVKDLAAGNYSISIHNGEDSNYNESRAETTFNVVKANTTITLDEDEINATIWKDVEIGFVVGPDFIGEGTVTLWINGEEYDNFTITQSDNSILILAKYLPNATKYNITVQYIGSDNFNASNVDSLILNVNKINITDKIAIDGSTIVYGENGTIEVEFGDLANLTGTVSVTLIGVNGIYTADVEGGYATVEIPGLLGNKTYPIQSVVYSGNDYYYGFTVNDERITIDVAPASSSVEINDIADVIYHGDVSVTYAVTNKTAVSIVVKDANGVEITKGINASVEGAVTISGLGAGKYTITVLNAASDNYNASSATKEFTVLKNSTIAVEPVVIGDKVVDSPLNITFTLPTDVNSSYVVAYLDGVALEEMLVNETTGVYTAVFDGFHVADGYRFNVEVNDPNYVEATGEVSFIITKVTPEIVIADIAGNVDDTVKVNVTIAGGDATGYILLDGKAFIVKDGKTTIDVVISTPGMQGITVEYTGDDKYFNATAKKGFNAGKGASTISFTDSVIDEFLDNDVEIEFVIAPGTINSGNVILWINGEVYDEFVITQSVNSIKILSKYLPTNGTYNITAQYMGNELYNASNVAELTLNITKVNCTIDINVPESTTSPVFSITLPEDAEGSLLVDINGQSYYAPIVNGTASITVPDLVAGNYTANITYTGDDKYPRISNTTTFNVPSNIPENAISIPASASTYNPTYGVTLPKDANGFIEVDIDGKKHYAVVKDGKASVSVPGLSTGAHNVTVTYSGDGKYTKTSKSATVILTEPVIILVGKGVTVTYTDTATYRAIVTIDGARMPGKTVTFNFNGKTYKVVSDSNGFADLKIKANLKPKSYKITATFSGVTIKNTIKVKNLIKAKNLKAKKSKQLKIKVSLKKVNGKYLKGKKLKLKFKGKTYKAKTNKKGKATFTIKKKVMAKLKKGKTYKYTVTYGKDKVTKKIKVKK